MSDAFEMLAKASSGDTRTRQGAPLGTATIDVLKGYASAWGVPVLLERPKSRRLLPGPGPWSIATWHRNPRLYHSVCEPIPPTRFVWPYLLHELAHVVCHVPPSDADEFSDTLGFEVLSIAHIGLSYGQYAQWFSDTWGPISEHDHVGDRYESARGLRWNEVGSDVRGAIEDDAKRLAVAHGLFAEDGTPTYRIARIRKASRT